MHPSIVSTRKCQYACELCRIWRAHSEFRMIRLWFCGNFTLVAQRCGAKKQQPKIPFNLAKLVLPA